MSLAPAPRPPSGAAHPEPVARSRAMREVIDAADDVAATPTTVLLLGESGTGKELLARFLHQRSRRAGDYVAVNCAALPAELLESELFGHERGAFTGASDRRAGRFEQAHRGTLLLDEISELPLPLQAKLLRVLQEREVDRVGGHRPVPVDVRVIATSNRDLGTMARQGLFRTDLFYRLSVFPIVLPPLRDRSDDLPELAAALLAAAAAALGRPAPALTQAALAALRGHPFLGNVRELRNVLERAAVRCRGPVLEASHLQLGGSAPSGPFDAAVPLAEIGAEGLARRAADTGAPAAAAAFPPSLPLDLDQLERLAIAEALRRTAGNRTHAARALNIGLRTLRNKLRVYRMAGTTLDPAGPAARPPWPTSVAADAAPPHGPIALPLRARVSQEERS